MKTIIFKRWKLNGCRIARLLCLVGLCLTAAQVASALSLKDVEAPEPTNLYAFLKGDPNGSEAKQAEAAGAKKIAIVLGKALFWDMQVGSDNIQACASCHFNAGADNRTKNQLTPGLAGMDAFGNSAIDGVPGPNDPPFLYGLGPNFDMAPEHFPFHRRWEPTAKVLPLDPGGEFFNVVMDTNDVMSSQGVRKGDSTDDPFDDTFNWKGVNQRRVEPRNAPTMINGVFHVDMFWDGRASFVFNGVNPFGFRDRDNKVKRNLGTAEAPDVQSVFVRIPFAAHASQSVGPPLSTLEMTGHDRSFPELAEKILDPDVNPLGLQMVHPEDSVLGPYAKTSYILNRNGRPTGRMENVPGMKNPDTGADLTYQELIEAAFKDEWWNGDEDQMKDNFSLFFGLAMQLYQATLISDDTPFDRFTGAALNVRGFGDTRPGTPIAPDPTALTDQELLGLDIFQGTNLSGRNTFTAPGIPFTAGCNECHFLPESSSHVVRLAGLAPPAGVVNDPLDPVNVLAPQAIIEAMPMGDGLEAVYDLGFYNIGVRPTEEDIGRAATAPPTAGFTGGLPLSYAELAFMKLNGQLTEDVAPFVPDLGVIEVVQPDGTIIDFPLELAELFARANNRIVNRGAFKVPNLRNQQFQGPYFHNGGDATLRQVVEFYARGGNFPATNIDFLDAGILFIPELDISNQDSVLAAEAEERIQALVAFLSRGLTDPRVVNKQAPFDHPQLFIPEGVTGNTPDLDKMKELKATGAGGGETITRFLGLDPQSP